MLSVCTAPGKTLARALLAGEDRERQPVAREGLIDAQHLHRLGARLGLRLMRGVALLPEEFRRAQEDARGAVPSAPRSPTD